MTILSAAAVEYERICLEEYGACTIANSTEGRVVVEDEAHSSKAKKGSSILKWPEACDREIKFGLLGIATLPRNEQIKRLRDALDAVGPATTNYSQSNGVGKKLA